MQALDVKKGYQVLHDATGIARKAKVLEVTGNQVRVEGFSSGTNYVIFLSDIVDILN